MSSKYDLVTDSLPLTRWERGGGFNQNGMQLELCGRFGILVVLSLESGHVTNLQRSICCVGSFERKDVTSTFMLRIITCQKFCIVKITTHIGNKLSCFAVAIIEKLIERVKLLHLDSDQHIGKKQKNAVLT